MSLRTVAPLDGGPHVKTAVDVQMTSAVRTVSPAAVHNGPRAVRAAAADHRRPADRRARRDRRRGGARRREPQRHLAYLRPGGAAAGPGETAVPLGGARGGAGAAVDGDRRVRVDGFVRAMLLFAPLMAVLDRGVALEAHGQNTLVVLRDGRPVRILYRDLGGVRVSAAPAARRRRRGARRCTATCPATTRGCCAPSWPPPRSAPSPPSWSRRSSRSAAPTRTRLWAHRRGARCGGPAPRTRRTCCATRCRSRRPPRCGWPPTRSTTCGRYLDNPLAAHG